MSRRADFLAGVIEGFYGQPWSQAERLELFSLMEKWGLNTYLYAPKDDLKHRAVWREVYTETELTKLKEVIEACKKHGIRFFCALSPGLDIRYTSNNDLNALRVRMEQMLGAGCRDFAFLFDDIPDRMDSTDLKKYGSLASAQAQLTNGLFRWVRERAADCKLLFCPTPYCGRMAAAKHGGEGYLETIGRELLPEIHVFWTGPDIISREISGKHVKELRRVLRRDPLIWDNLHANDYDGRRFYCGPYSGRPLELTGMVSGILSNPNNEFPLNYVPLRTLAAFVAAEADWNPRGAYVDAMREWLPRFSMLRDPISLEELLLLGDCYYLPHEDGPAADSLYAQANALLSTDPITWGAAAEDFLKQALRLRDLCGRLGELRDRPLFYALSRRVWELREEMDLLAKYVEYQSKHGVASGRWKSDFHLPSTYRGGLVARLQRLLVLKSDGSFAPAATETNQP